MAKVKILQQDILTAAIEVIRKDGIRGLNARAVANELHCSTQPIYSVFANMDELRTALREEAKRRYAQWVSVYLDTKQPTDYKAYGMGFVRFAKEEKELFRFLYLQQLEGWKNDPAAAENKQTVDMMMKIYGVDEAEATAVHDRMSIFSFGLAVMQNRGAEYSEETVSVLLSDQFQMLKAKYFEKQN